MKIENPACQVIFNGAKEVVLVVATVAAVVFAAAALCAFNPPMSLVIFGAVVLAPVGEEIFFRGFVQEGVLHNFQRVKNYFYGPQSDEDLKSQKIFRVHAAAFLFGILHVVNPGSLKRKVLQCSLWYVNGTSYGYLAEKCETVAIPIFLHALNNGICIVGTMTGLGIPATITVLAIDVFLLWYSRLT